jgi:Ca-activated chloride channel homolog
VLPQKDAVRVEEMINYFPYDYEGPADRAEPFKASVTLMPTPWNPDTRLMHVGIKGFALNGQEKPRSNLVFLLDTSGSMEEPNKLPLLRNSLKMLTETLGPEDTVSIVVYAGSAGTVLEPTKVKDKAKILAALDNLSAGGSTAGAEGIRQAYQLAEQSFDSGDRWRLQRRHHGSGGAQEFRGAQAGDGHLPLGAGLRTRQLQ